MEEQNKEQVELVGETQIQISLQFVLSDGSIKEVTLTNKQDSE